MKLHEDLELINIQFPHHSLIQHVHLYGLPVLAPCRVFQYWNGFL